MGRPKGSKNKIFKKVKRICQFCKKEFYVFPFVLKVNKGKFCSKQCKYAFGHTEISKIKISMNSFQKGKTAWNKGKIMPQLRKPRVEKVIDKDGYIMVYMPYHPFANRNRDNYILEHRLVMEKCLGRYLRPEEVVHHIDEVRTNNSIENLMLFPNKKMHRKFHKSIHKDKCL